MNDQDRNLPTSIAEWENGTPDDIMSDEFDPALAFADPVTYLARLGLRSELTETSHRGFPAAA